MGEQNSDICFLWYWPGASSQKVSPIAIVLFSIASLFLLFIMWCPIFNNKCNLENVRCFGNAVYFFAMAVFSTRVPLFISGFKKSVWVINERGDSLKIAFEWRFSAVRWKFHGNISFQPGCSNSMYSYNPDWRGFEFVFDPAPNFIPCQIYNESFQLNTYSELVVELDYSNWKLCSPLSNYERAFSK